MVRESDLLMESDVEFWKVDADVIDLCVCADVDVAVINVVGVCSNDVGIESVVAWVAGLEDVGID